MVMWSEAGEHYMMRKSNQAAAATRTTRIGMTTLKTLPDRSMSASLFA